MILTAKFETPIGEMMAGATGDGLCLLEFTDKERHIKELGDLKHLLKSDIQDGENIFIKETEKQLKEYFDGERRKFNLPLIIPGSEFQKSVWIELLNISFGTTRSYKEQAEAIQMPDSARAVARANGMNRIAIIIPCHRVIGSGGDLSGYAGGLTRKKWLLVHERKYSGKEGLNELPFKG